MRALLLPAFALALSTGFLAAPEAQARFNASQLQAPTLVENARCVTRRVRTVRPNGRVVYRTVRRCGVRPGFNRGRPFVGRRVERCRVIRERVRLRNGNVIYRNIRRCR